ncbi:MAG: hypothetical protein KDB53_03855 [Planctomycetes bacterium]|nr:hypothetical protein [Planctomycetota bacterium]
MPRTVALVSLILIVVSTLWAIEALSVGALRLQDAKPHARASEEAAKASVGGEYCAECHVAEHEALLASHHGAGEDTMHKTELAKTIAEALGVRRIKRDEACVECHYAPVFENDRYKIKQGVSCESCHGPAEAWVDLHDDLGDDAVETAEHRRHRVESTLAKGMRRPDHVYDLARGCYECHVVAGADLVKAGHATGEGFELVAWSQGEVRHNFLASDGETNAKASVARLRVLWVVGQALELEVSLERLASGKPTAPGLKERAAAAAANLKKAGELLGAQTEIVPMVAAHAALKADADATALRAAAAAIGAANRSFAKGRDGRDLGPLDVLLPQPAGHRGKVHRP